MREINLSEWTKAGEGYEADSYNNNSSDEIMLKLYKPNILTTKIEASFNASMELINMGINTPKAIEIVTCDGRMGVIYERVKNKISLYRMFVNNHENAREYGKIFGNAVKEFHKHKCDKSKAVSRNSVLRNVSCGMISNVKTITDEQKSELIKATNKFFDDFKETENDNTLLLGDAHTGNIIIANDKLYYIDLASLVYGDPILEIGWIYAGQFNKHVNEILPKEEHIPMEYKEMFWDEFIHTYYEGLDEDTLNKKIEKAKRYAAVQNLFISIYMNPTYESMMENLK